MAEITNTPKEVLKYKVEVQEQGRVEITVPFPPGVRVLVFVIEEPCDTFNDLVSAARTSIDFWDNPFDDQDWNDA